MAIATLGYRVDSSQVSLAQRRLEGMSGAAGVAAGAARSFMAAAAAAFASGAIVREISTFESSMSRVAAISRATATDLSDMREVARDLGATTRFSASEAADGLGFLAMAGFDAKEAMAAIPDILDLATASGMGLATAADIASNIMGSFDVSAANAAEVTDVLALAAASANTDVTQLGEAIINVGSTANTLGVSLETTAAAVGTMSNMGLQGARAGTAFRGVLAALAGPTDTAREALEKYGLTMEQVNPETNSLAEIMERLKAAGISTADTMTIFGREMANGAFILMNNADMLRDLEAELVNADGAAKTMARTMGDNLGGDIKDLQSAVSDLILSFSDAGLGGALRAVTKTITEMVRGFSGAIEAIGSLTGFVIAGAIAMTVRYIPALFALASMARTAVASQIALEIALGATSTKAALASIAVKGLSAALIILKKALIAVGIGALIVGAGMLINELLALVEATGSWGAALDLLGQVAKGVWEGIKTSAEAISPALSAVWADMEASFLFAIANMASGFSSFMQNFTSLSALPDFGITAPFKALGDAANAVTSSIDDLSGSAMAAAARADGLRVRAGQLATQGFDTAREALDKLNVVVEENSEGTKTAEQTAQELAAAMAAVEGAAGGNSGGGAAGAVKGLTDELSEAESAGKKFADSMAGHFDGLITGGKSFGDVLQGIAGQLESQLWQNLFSGGIGAAPAGGGGGIGGWLAGIGTSIGNSLGGMFSFDGGGYTGAGPRSGGIDGRGGFPAILHPNETVVDHTRGQSIGGGNVTNITINTPPGMTAQTQERDVNGVREVLIELKQAVADDIRRNGTVGQAMTQTFGLGRALGA